MAIDNDPGRYVIPDAAAVIPPITFLPQSVHQETLANLGIGGSINFDFHTDLNPIFDLFVFADQVITVNVFLRQSDADTFRLLNNAAYGVGVINVLTQVMQGARFSGSQVRIQLANNSGVATTTLSAQVHSRSA